MAQLNPRAKRVIRATAALALILLALSVVLLPPEFDRAWTTILATLLILSFASELLALKVTEGGTETSMDFVPQLGAVLLIGPSGAAILTVISWTVYQTFLSDNPPHKAVFNVGQSVISITGAGLLFVVLGGDPSTNSFHLSQVIFPFAATVVAYFSINSLAVTYIIAVTEDKEFPAVWQELSLTPFVFDLLISSLALLVAYLYVTWNALAMLTAIIPIIGLRYSYGVNLELKQLNSDLLRALINTIEAQDPYTSGHSLRVAEGALAISEAIGLSGRKRRAIETAALLHDIGKLDSSFHAILKKSSSLTQSEWELIQQHPERGVNIVQPIRSLDGKVLDYIRHHHERYDGTGYPEELESENIPIGARVIMVADTIDAMVTARPYRDRIDPDRVREELKDKAGEQFDPELVDVALEIDLPGKMAEAAHSQIREETEEDISIDGQL